MSTSSSRIEEIITELEEYMDTCRPQTFSATKIIVEKARVDELLEELRQRTPDEIKRYQRIVSNREAILADARAQADQMIADATEQTKELVNEHEIMQQAYKKANEVIDNATAQAQQIVDEATREADQIRTSGISYVEDMLRSMDALISHTVENSVQRHNSYIASLTNTSEIIRSNLAELAPAEGGAAPAEAPADYPEEEVPEDAE